jgi:RpiR family carbohydrate utilization transcriptional regulator
MNLAGVARGAGVSEPTVIRFARKLGSSGFPSFKIRLAQDLATQRPYVPQEVDFNDTLPVIFEKVLSSNIIGLGALRQSIDLDLLAAAVERIANANRIFIFAEGLSSSLVAADLQRKLIFLQVNSLFYPEIPLQVLSATNTSESDMSICISLTGYNKHVLNCARLAAANGSDVISITRSGTDLSDISTVLLSVDTVENVYWYTQVATRLAQLTVIDILSTGIALRRGPRIREAVKSLKETTKSAVGTG